jgi:hypothetical protein
MLGELGVRLCRDVEGKWRNSSKDRRFAEFLARLSAAPSVGTAQAALSLVSDTLNQVEDELTNIPYTPENWQTDGRMYPPQSESARGVSGRDDLVRYRNKAHNTYIRNNGAIEISDTHGTVIFSEAGADGKGVELHSH